MLLKRKRSAGDVYASTIASKREAARMKRRRVAQSRGVTVANLRSVARTRGPIGTETKYFDGQRIGITVVADESWAGTEVDLATFNTLFCPAVGAAFNQRIGRKVFLRKLVVRGILQQAAQAAQTGADQGITVRLVLFQDMQTNAVQAQGEELMLPSVAANDIAIPCAFQNPANFGRFRVLKDKTFTIGDANISWNGTNMSQQGINKTFKFVVRFREPVCVSFNNTNGGSVADIVDNSFHMLANATTTGDLTLHYNVRGYYSE